MLRTLTGHKSTVYSVAYSPDGRTLASGSYDNTIKLWDVATGQLLCTLTGHTDFVYSVAFSPDGRTSINFWDSATHPKARDVCDHVRFSAPIGQKCFT